MYYSLSFCLNSMTKSKLTFVVVVLVLELLGYDLPKTLLLALLLLRHLQIVKQSFQSLRGHLVDVSVIVYYLLVDVLFHQQVPYVVVFGLIEFILFLLLDILVDHGVYLFLGHRVFPDLLRYLVPDSFMLDRHPQKGLLELFVVQA